MGVTYFKRYRMEIPFQDAGRGARPLPDGYHLLRWKPTLVECHAEAKYRSFCAEIDAHVFPCLGDYEGCLRLMEEISAKPTFVADATWLLIHHSATTHEIDYCGTIQGIAGDAGCGSIQNLGVTPEHRGRGLGTHILLRSLEGFERAGMQRVSLEVTAQNADAVRLYRRLGFRRVKTVYKAVAVAYS